ncbi:uncharacterized protein LOC126842587 [Adelges cooleyi]|uniref:uncharacterized protein LOC126842587 n=1 Tax=Adelges cooleyi TaxID=133065 RepID=UPI00217FC6FD|nr:uncharacterized protein LOC126842587 [Adelges cooleyi]
MKSNTSFALFAVCLFGLIASLNGWPMGIGGSKASGTSETSDSLPVSLNSTPMVPSGGETSGTSETSNNLHESIRRYIINILTHKDENTLTVAVQKTIRAPDFLKKLDDFKDNVFITVYSKFQLDPEFIARINETKDLIIFGVDEKDSINQDNKARITLFDITKKKLKEKLTKNELKTLKYTAKPEDLNEIITVFINDIKRFKGNTGIHGM